MAAINVVIVSGEIGWIKMKYNSLNKPYVHFGIKQPKFIFEDGKVVGKTYRDIYMYCFDLSILANKPLKEGLYITAQGHIESFKDEQGKTRNNIAVDVIDIQPKNSHYEKQEIPFG